MARLLVSLILLGLVYLLYREIKAKKQVYEAKKRLDDVKAQSEVLDVEEEIALQTADNDEKKSSIDEFEGKRDV